VRSCVCVCVWCWIIIVKFKTVGDINEYRSSLISNDSTVNGSDIGCNRSNLFKAHARTSDREYAIADLFRHFSNMKVAVVHRPIRLYPDSHPDSCRSRRTAEMCHSTKRFDDQCTQSEIGFETLWHRQPVNTLYKQPPAMAIPNYHTCAEQLIVAQEATSAAIFHCRLSACKYSNCAEADQELFMAT